MKVQNTPVAYGFLAGLLVLLFGLIVAEASCTRVPPPSHPSGSPTRSMRERAEATVSIYTECGSGTGVIVDARRVLTASHVVHCGHGTESQFASTMAIRTLDNKVTTATVEVDDPEHDVARIVLGADVVATPVTIRKVGLKEAACAYTAIPERAVRCGIVSDTANEPRQNGDVFVAGANVWYGNSGSGVYGADGALIGILVRLRYCNAEDAFFAQFGERPVTCGGYVSSITDTKVML